MKTPNEEIAAWAVSEITCCRAVCDYGGGDKWERNPDKVDALIFNHFMKDEHRFHQLPEAIQAMAATDTQIWRILDTLRAHHTLRFRWEGKGKESREVPVVAWTAASETWALVLKKLKAFAAQKGGQKLVPKERIKEVGAELSKIVRELAESGKS